MKVLDRFPIKNRGWGVAVDGYHEGIKLGVVLMTRDGRLWRVDGVGWPVRNGCVELLLVPLPPTDGPPEIGEELG